jgi:GNAT superfamily N-acetyltransferase
MTDDLRIEETAADYPAFAAVRERVGYPLPDDPVPTGARCLIAYLGAEPAARCAVTTADGLHGAPGHMGMIGHYEAVDRAAGVAILAEALRILPDVDRVLGPINGSTWGRYRLALPGDAPPFLSEPTNPAEYVDDFTAAGFSVAAWYESARVTDLATPDPRAAAAPERLRARGVTVRALRPDRFDEELEALYALTVEAFAENLYYSPVSFAEFRARYTPLRPLLDPELVRLAEEAEGRLLGYVFAFPDLLTMSAGRPTRVVLKTLASAQGARGLGLGTFLGDEIRRLAHERGYTEVIHALMHVQNASVGISRHTADVFRRYALYEWTP